MATRHKAKASAYTPQSRDDVQAAIKRLGDLVREHTRLTTEMNDAIAAISEAAAPRLRELTETADTVRAGIQAWCEAHRDELTSGGKTKTANLVTGEVNWRTRPPSVTVRNVEGVLDTLRRMGLAQFIRVKEEINKEAVLAEPDAARGIAGLTVTKGVEDFVVTPFEINTTEAA